MAHGALPRSLRLLTVGLLLGSCGGEPDNLFVIHLDSLPEQAKSVELAATLDGKAAQAQMQITSPIDTFFVQLPETTSGELLLGIAAVDADLCTEATAIASFQLPVAFQDTHVALVPQRPRKCGSLPPCAANTVCAVDKPPSGDIQAIWPSSALDIWAVGGAGLILHFNGASWSTVPAPTGVTSNLNAIWGSSPSDVWAVGAAGTVLHYDGSKWSTATVPTARSLFGIWGTSASDIYIVGDAPDTTMQGAMLHYNGTTWISIADVGIGAGRLNGVWADKTGDYLVYACGVSGLLTRMNGTKWDVIASGTTSNLHAIWGTPDHTMFAVGDGGKIISVRYSDATPGWGPVANVPTTSLLWGVRGDSSGKVVYAVGDNGVVLRADAPFSTFTAQTSATSSPLFAVAPASNGLVWTGGKAGFLGFLDMRP